MNDTIQKRESQLTLEKDSVPLPGLCELLPAEWFSSESRFSPCIIYEELEASDRPFENPTLFDHHCANPLEWIAFWAIIIGVVSIKFLNF